MCCVGVVLSLSRAHALSVCRSVCVLLQTRFSYLSLSSPFCSSPYLSVVCLLACLLLACLFACLLLLLLLLSRALARSLALRHASRSSLPLVRFMTRTRFQSMYRTPNGMHPSFTEIIEHARGRGGGGEHEGQSLFKTNSDEVKTERDRATPLYATTSAVNSKTRRASCPCRSLLMSLS